MSAIHTFPYISTHMQEGTIWTFNFVHVETCQVENIDFPFGICLKQSTGVGMVVTMAPAVSGEDSCLPATLNLHCYEKVDKSHVEIHNF